MEIIEIDNIADLKCAFEKNKLVIIDCYANWCGPCKSLAAKFKSYAYGYTGKKIIVCKLNIENCDLKSFVEKYDITSLPTLLLFNGINSEPYVIVGFNWAAVEKYITTYNNIQLK